MLILDMSSVSDLSTPGADVLLSVLRCAAAQNGGLLLAAPNPRVVGSLECARRMRALTNARRVIPRTVLSSDLLAQVGVPVDLTVFPSVALARAGVPDHLATMRHIVARLHEVQRGDGHARGRQQECHEPGAHLPRKGPDEHEEAIT